MVGVALKYLLAFLPVSCVRLYSVKKKKTPTSLLLLVNTKSAMA